MNEEKDHLIHPDCWVNDSHSNNIKPILKGQNPLTNELSCLSEVELDYSELEKRVIESFNNESVIITDGHDKPKEFQINIEFYFNIKKITHTKTITIKAHNKFEALSILKTQYTNLIKIDFINDDIEPGEFFEPWPSHCKIEDFKSLIDKWEKTHLSKKREPKGADLITENYYNKEPRANVDLEKDSVNHESPRIGIDPQKDFQHKTSDLFITDVQLDFIIPEPQEFEIDIEFYFNTKKVMHTKTVTIKAHDEFEAESILKTQYLNLTRIDFKTHDGTDSHMGRKSRRRARAHKEIKENC